MKFGAIVAGIALIATTPVYAQTNTSAMLSTCKNRGAAAYGTARRQVVVKYEGQRTDGTHAVNGTYRTPKVIYTFQCSFNHRGNRIVKFIKNRPQSLVNEGTL